MIFRTDLALECRENINSEIDGVLFEKRRVKDSTITNIKIESE